MVVISNHIHDRKTTNIIILPFINIFMIITDICLGKLLDVREVVDGIGYSRRHAE